MYVIQREMQCVYSLLVLILFGLIASTTVMSKLLAFFTQMAEMRARIICMNKTNSVNQMLKTSILIYKTPSH